MVYRNGLPLCTGFFTKVIPNSGNPFRLWLRSKNMRIPLLFLFLLFFSFLAKAQEPYTELYGIHARWSDSFSEWSISTPDDPQAGVLERQWLMGNDWSQWNIRFAGYSGTVRQKWKNNPQQWELRHGNDVITMRPVFPGDPNSWRIVTGSKTFTWSREFRHLDAKWTIERVPGFTMYTEYEGDPRDWIIVDEAPPQLNTAARLAMVFLTTYYSTPKQ